MGVKAAWIDDGHGSPGWIYRWTTSTWFSRLIMGVIIFAGVLVGLETSQWVVEHYGGWLYGLDKVVIAIFTVEVAMKIWVGFHYGEEGERRAVEGDGQRGWWRRRWVRVRAFFSEPWNVFDFVIVVVSIIPLVGAGTLYLRMARLFRILRLVRIIPTLPQAHVATVWGARRAFIYILFLLALVFYMFSVAGVFLFGANDPVHFGDLRLSMLSLFRVVTLEGWTEVMYVQLYGCDVVGFGRLEHLCTDPESFPILAPLYFVSFILVGSIIFLNMFIGVIVTAMDDAARQARERQLYEAAELAMKADTEEDEGAKEAMRALRMHLMMAEGKLGVLKDVATNDERGAGEAEDMAEETMS